MFPHRVYLGGQIHATHLTGKSPSRRTNKIRWVGLYSLITGWFSQIKELNPVRLIWAVFLVSEILTSSLTATLLVFCTPCWVFEERHHHPNSLYCRGALHTAGIMWELTIYMWVFCLISWLLLTHGHKTLTHKTEEEPAHHRMQCSVGMVVVSVDRKAHMVGMVLVNWADRWWQKSINLDIRDELVERQRESKGKCPVKTHQEVDGGKEQILQWV